VGSDGNEILVLGGFRVRLGGMSVDEAHWRRRPAARLVKVLALARDRRLHREQVMDALWPDLMVDEATPRLHKAVHVARRALGATDALATAGDSMQLLPGRHVVIDVVEFEAAAAGALDGPPDRRAIEAALVLHGGELLPDDRFEPWAQQRREHVAYLHRRLLRAVRRWSELLALDPADEAAHVALIRQHVEAGDRASALAQHDRLVALLREHLGVEPGPEAHAAREAALALPASPPAAVDIDGLPPQEIRFCHAADGTRLAYAVVGRGQPFVKAANWMTHLEYDWESQIWRHWLVALTNRFRLLRYDERGCGLSEWNTTSFSLDAWVDDLDAVVEAAGYERFPLLGVSQGSAVAVTYAVRHPERVSALIIYGGYAHGRSGRSQTEDERRAGELLPQLAELGWGSDEPSFRQVFTTRFMPRGTREQWNEFNELQRRSTSAANAARFLRAFSTIDVTEVARHVRCPTLVVRLSVGASVSSFRRSEPVFVTRAPRSGLANWQRADERPGARRRTQHDVLATVAPMLSYLDPGTGSMLAAALAGGFAGFVVFVKMYGHRLLGVVSKKHRAQAEEARTELMGNVDADG